MACIFHFPFQVITIHIKLVMTRRQSKLSGLMAISLYPTISRHNIWKIRHTHWINRLENHNVCYRIT